MRKSLQLVKTGCNEFGQVAIYFYKQLPNQPLSLADLILFEVQSVRFEISMVLLLATIMGLLVALLPMLSAFVVNVLLTQWAYQTIGIGLLEDWCYLDFFKQFSPGSIR